MKASVRRGFENLYKELNRKFFNDIFQLQQKHDHTHTHTHKKLSNPFSVHSLTSLACKANNCVSTLGSSPNLVQGHIIVSTVCYI